jgi:multidrug efflux pump subunit AcrA (membrane-fusion protein)
MRNVILAAGGALLLFGCSVWLGLAHRSGDEAAETEARPAVPVTLARAEVREFEDRLAVQGNVQAKDFAIVPARVSGVLDDVFVDEGDAVTAGETKLFAVDFLTLQKVVEQRRQDTVVAALSRKEREAVVESTAASLKKAETDYGRFTRLHETGVTTAEALETYETQYNVWRAELVAARARAALAAEQENRAQVELSIAEKDLADAVVLAPLSGTITKRYHEPGEMAAPGLALLRIENLDVVEVSALLPSQYFCRVRADETRARVRVRGREAGERVITYKSPTIDPALRTFEVKCLIQDPPEGVVPGALAEMVVLFERRQGTGIPAEAVQRRDDRAVLFTVEGDVARMTAVETGLENDGWVELRGDALPAGTPVVTMGQFLLQEGTPVKVQGEAK